MALLPMFPEPTPPLISVRRINVEETLPIRWPVLRAGLPREAAIFPGDDHPQTRHLGVFVETKLAGVVTIYPAPLPERPEQSGAWQLRGMAVTPERQRQGLGRELLRACVTTVLQEGGRFIWCNARLVALEFYRQAGFTTLGEQFEIPTAGPHFRMRRELGSS